MTHTPTATPTRTNTPTELGPRISFLAAVNEDGCLNCCEFDCRLTPTPTPRLDSAGREIFVRTGGQVLLAIEGARGTSNRDPGERILVTGAQRPDAQVLFSQPLGDGSPEICDIGPPPAPFGGVPGFDPPDFGPSASVTAALQDFSCRLTVERTSSDACTKDRFGVFNFLGQSTRKQFCVLIPLAAGFQFDDTIVAVQLVDTAGNLGPKKEIIVRVEP
jgi:hypothetical protein